MGMTINWFPGHMAKTRRQIGEICKDKPRVILLNKSDLAEDKVTKQWIEKLTTDTVRPLAVNCITGQGLKGIKITLDELLKEKHDRQRKKGLVNIVTRVM